MKITVITCTFGRPDQLRHAVESVNEQTLPSDQYRHLVVEDADNPSPIKEMGLEGPLLMTMHDRSGYPGFLCRNSGVRAATTDLVAFLDDDNWYEPDHLETLLALQESSGADFVWSSTRLVDPNGSQIGFRDSPEPEPGVIDISEILCRRSLFIGCGGLDPRDGIRGDGLMIWRWVHNGARYAHSKKVTLNYQVNGKENRAAVHNECREQSGGYHF